MLAIERFGKVAPDIVDFDDLTHLVTGAVCRYADALIASGDMKALARVFDFFACLTRHSRQVDPAILNAISVSFLEGVRLDHPVHGQEATRILPPVLRQMRDAQFEHNRRIGWWS
jgi:hypothetical protein